MFEKQIDSLFKRHENKKDEAEKLMNDLRQVGPQKPLGYLPIDTLTKFCRVSPESIKEELEKRGLKTLRLNETESGISSGAFYAYDEHILQNLLDSHKKLLTEEGWPTTSQAFIKNLHVHATPKTDLFNLIADAFNDKKNPLRKPS